MPDPFPIETRRLVLRHLVDDDVEAMVAYRSDPDVARYQSWDESWSVEDARRLVARRFAATLGEPGSWHQVAIEEAETGALVGDIGLHFVADQPDTVELGITVAPEFHGQGIAGEALDAILGWLFEEAGVHRVYTISDVRNEQLHRLVRRHHFRHEATHIEADWFKGEWTTIVVHALLDREWAVRHERP